MVAKSEVLVFTVPPAGGHRTHFSTLNCACILEWAHPASINILWSFPGPAHKTPQAHFPAQRALLTHQFCIPFFIPSFRSIPLRSPWGEGLPWKPLFTLGPVMDMLAHPPHLPDEHSEPGAGPLFVGHVWLPTWAQHAQGLQCSVGQLPPPSFFCATSLA